MFFSKSQLFQNSVFFKKFRVFSKIPFFKIPCFLKNSFFKNSIFFKKLTFRYIILSVKSPLEKRTIIVINNTFFLKIYYLLNHVSLSTLRFFNSSRLSSCSKWRYSLGHILHSPGSSRPRPLTSCILTR